MNRYSDVSKGIAATGELPGRITNLPNEVVSRLTKERHALERALKQPDTTYLVVPSISVDHEEIQFIQRALVDYEHRLLWLINRAENGRRVVFVSALPTSRAATSQLLCRSVQPRQCCARNHLPGRHISAAPGRQDSGSSRLAQTLAAYGSVRRQKRRPGAVYGNRQRIPSGRDPGYSCGCHPI